MDTLFLIESQEEFQKALEEVLNNYSNSDVLTETIKDRTVLKTAREDLKRLIQDSNFDTNKVPELLIPKGWDEQKVAYFVKSLNEKKTELLYATLTNHNSEYGETITNFDWLLKLVLGTSELNTLKHPLLQLVLSTESNRIHEKILYDLNKDTLLKLIDTLEKLEDIDKK